MNHDAQTLRAPLSGRKRFFRWLLAGSGLAVLAVGIFVLNLFVRDNFHVVSPGQIFRSGQMSTNAFAHTVRDYGIKSVLNLRDDGDPASDENTLARRLGVQHFGFRLSATREVTDAEIEQVLALVAAAPKPILIHCKAGSDRAGLVSALCLYRLEGQTAATADRQLSVYYGHVPYLFWNKTGAMDASFWRYVGNHTAGQFQLGESSGSNAGQLTLSPPGTR